MKSRFSRIVAAALVAGVLVPFVSAAAPATPPAPGREDVVFMGIDLTVARNKKSYRVEDVDGSEFVITVGNKKQFVPTRNRTNNIKIDHELKYSSVSALLDDLAGGPGYTPANDPRLKMIARSGAAAGAAAARDLAYQDAVRFEDAMEKSRAAGNVQSAEQMKEMMENSYRQEATAGTLLSSDYSSVGAHANAEQLELAEENYDMVEISFKISSPVPLDDPYMVILVEFTQRGAKPGETSMLIHAKALDPVDAKPKYVRVREGGMPMGFKFQRYEVHLFNRGKEVATNASPKRVALSRDDARQYLLIQYLAANKKTTTPPSVVEGSLPAAWRARVKLGERDNQYYVRVAKDGTLIGVYSDEAASLPIGDEETMAMFKEAFFKPALAEGKPQDGIAKVRLGDLVL